MPRGSREQMDHNRQIIEQESARLFQEQGLRGVSVDQVMAASGLTRGGFYGHFPSKDALAAVACAKAFEQCASRWKKRVQGRMVPAKALQAFVAAYLSSRSRDEAGSSCPVVALAGDIVREPADKPVHDAFIAGVKQQLDFLLSLQEPGDPATERPKVMVQFATLVGSLLLARATRGDSLSAAFLTAARTHLGGAEQP